MKKPIQYSQDILNSLKDALEKNYSAIVGKKHSLLINNIQFDNLPDPDDYERHRAALDKNKSEGVNVYADVKLVDNNTNKTIDERQKLKLGLVPTVTNRHSFVINGREYIVHNQFRLKPAIYTKYDRNDLPVADFNLAKGYNMSIRYVPHKQRFFTEIGNSSVPLYTILKNVYNTPDAELKKAFGDEFHEQEMSFLKKDGVKELTKLNKLINPSNPTDDPNVMVKQIKDKLDKTEMDMATNKMTMGKPYAKVTPESLIHAAKDVLDIYKEKKDPTKKDNLAFKKILSAEDFIHEKFTKKAPEVKNIVKFKVDKIDKVSGALLPNRIQGLLNEFFVDSNLVNFPIQVNTFEMLENAHKITGLGDGAISDTNALPLSARNIDTSYLGFIDPVRTPDNMRAGIDNRISIGAWKEGDTLKTYAVDKKGNQVEITPQDLYDKVYTVHGEKPITGNLYRAYHKGKMVEVPKSQIDYFLAPNLMFTPTTGSIPFADSNHPQRCAMGAKMTAQSLSLIHREAPLVGTNADTILPNNFVPKAKADGIVHEITPNKIIVKDNKGNLVNHNIPNNFALNYHSFLHVDPLVKVGDKVTKGQLLGDNNYTVNGKHAIGTNLHVAFMPWKGYNFEDGFVLTQQGADKLASQHIFQEELIIPNDSVVTDVKKFTAYYPKRFNLSQLGTLEDNVVRVGTKLHAGDPIIVALKAKAESPEAGSLGKLVSRLANPYNDASIVWDKDFPGEVLSVTKQPSFIKVAVKATTPFVVGDKIAGRHGNKGVVTLIVPNEEAPRTLDGRIPDLIANPAGIPSRKNSGQVLETVVGKIVKENNLPQYNHDFFDGTNKWEKVNNMVKKYKTKLHEDFIDPVTKAKIPNVFNGQQYILKLFKQADTSFSARAGGQYDIDLRPIKGGEEGSKNVGALDLYGVIGHYGMPSSVLSEMSTYKAEYNPNVWQSVLEGKPLPAPTPTFTFQKFMAMMQGMGINLKKEGNQIKLLPFTKKDILNISNGEITQPTVVNTKKDPKTGLPFRPETGGIFDPAKTGGLQGSKWTHINLSVPVANAFYSKPIRALLDLKQGDYNAINNGEQFVNIDGKKLTGGSALKAMLSKVNTGEYLEDLQNQLPKTRSVAKKDAIAKKIMYLSKLKQNGLKADEAYILDTVPVIPPKFRPIYPDQSGKLVVSDINHIYKSLIENNNLMNSAYSKSLPQDHADYQDLHKNLINLVQKVQGLDQSSEFNPNPREPKGFLKTITGSNAKYGYFQSKLLSKAQDIVGRGVVVVDPTLGMDEVSLPEPMAWKIYSPFVIGQMVKNGYQLPKATEEVEKRTTYAKNILQTEMNQRPVIVNRPPTLHRHNMSALKPKLNTGKFVKFNPLIVKSYNLDYDGDSNLGSVFYRNIKSNLHVDNKNPFAYNIIYQDNIEKTKGDNSMLSQNENIRYNQGLINLKEFPRLEETKSVKGNTEYYKVPEGIEVLTARDGKKQWLPVESFSVHKELEMVQVETSSGRTLQVSTDHSLVTVDDNFNYIESVPQIGLMLPRLRNPIEKHEYNLMTHIDIDDDQSGLTHQMKEQIPLSFNFGFYIAAAVSDGWVSGNSEVIIAKTCPDLEVFIREECLPSLFNTKVAVYTQDSPHKFSKDNPTECFSKKIISSSVLLYKYVAQWIGKGAANKHLPEFWMQTPEEFRWGLLSGLINGDGTVSIVAPVAKKGKTQTQIHYDTISRRLAYEVVALAHSLDLTAGVHPYKSTSKGTQAYAVHFTQESIAVMRNKLFLTVKNKKDALSKYEPSDTITRNKLTPMLTSKHILELRSYFKAVDVNANSWKTNKTEEDTVKQKSINSIYAELGKRSKLHKSELPRDFARRICSYQLPIWKNEFWSKWKQIVLDDNIEWEKVVSITPLPNITEAYDLTIPPAYTMVTESGIVVWDTVTSHVVMTDDAKKEAWQMTPSNNLFNTLTRNPIHLPQQECVFGLHQISKPNDNKTKTFKTKQDAIGAYHRGEIGINDPIEVLVA